MKIVSFSAQWCQPCKSFAPVFDNVKKKYESNNLMFIKLDVENDYEITSEYGIKGLPCTLLLDDDGNEVKRLLGSVSEERILAWLPEEIKNK
jgi:thioredoxin 1